MPHPIFIANMSIIRLSPCHLPRPLPYPIQCYTDTNDNNKTVCPHCCQYPTKAAVALRHGAAGYVSLVQHPSPSDAPAAVPNVTEMCEGFKDIDVDSLKPFYDLNVVYADGVDGVLDWVVADGNPALTPSPHSNATSSARILVWDRRFFPWENVFNWALIGFIATFSMTVSSYTSGLVSYRLYRVRFASRIRKMAKKRAEMRAAAAGEGAAGEGKEGEEDAEGDTCSTPDILGGEKWDGV